MFEKYFAFQNKYLCLRHDTEWPNVVIVFKNI